MTTALIIYLIGLGWGVSVLTLHVWHTYKAELRSWWKANRPHWSDAKRRFKKYLSGEHIRYMAGIVAGYLLAVSVFALLWFALVITTP